MNFVQETNVEFTKFSSEFLMFLFEFLPFRKKEPYNINTSYCEERSLIRILKLLNSFIVADIRYIAWQHPRVRIFVAKYIKNKWHEEIRNSRKLIFDKYVVVWLVIGH